MSSLLKQLCLTRISKCLRAWELVFPHNSRRCSFFLTTLLASLASIFRSRASLGLENLALRHQIGVLHRSAGKRPKLTSGGPPAVDLSVAPLARFALDAGHRQARKGRSKNEPSAPPLISLGLPWQMRCVQG